GGRRREGAWSGRGRREAPRRSSAPLAVQRPELGELTLEERAEPADVLLVLALHLGGLALHLGLGGARRVENAPPLGLGLPHHDLRLPLRDRKSTRLNSSHDQISYAVFCLKKKKKKTIKTNIIIADRLL